MRKLFLTSGMVVIMVFVNLQCFAQEDSKFQLSYTFGLGMESSQLNWYVSNSNYVSTHSLQSKYTFYNSPKLSLASGLGLHWLGDRSSNFMIFEGTIDPFFGSFGPIQTKQRLLTINIPIYLSIQNENFVSTTGLKGNFIVHAKEYFALNAFSGRLLTNENPEQFKRFGVSLYQAVEYKIALNNRTFFIGPSAEFFVSNLLDSGIGRVHFTGFGPAKYHPLVLGINLGLSI
ncbi:MAG: hypothetical protein ACI8ZN_000931 [Bacteroidia bacterium]|jgi:hypothetical protein